MRTSITLAELHDGTERLLAGRNIPVQEQLQSFRKFLGIKSHPEFKTISFQESDGEARFLRFRSEIDQKAVEETRAKEAAEQAAAMEAQKLKDAEKHKPKELPTLKKQK